MRHGHGYRKLGRDTAHRLMMLRNQVTDLIRYERIETTVTRAKELRKLADKMVTLGKSGTVSSRQQARSVLLDRSLEQKLFSEFKERYQDRPGGYTRVLRSRRRKDDAAPMAWIEFIDREGELRTPRPPTPNHPLAAARALLEGSANPTASKEAPETKK